MTAPCIIMNSRASNVAIIHTNDIDAGAKSGDTLAISCANIGYTTVAVTAASNHTTPSAMSTTQRYTEAILDTGYPME